MPTTKKKYKQKTVSEGRVRDYKRERLRETKGRKLARNARGRARTALGLKVGDGKVAHHTKAVSKGGLSSKVVAQSQKASNKEGGRRAPKSGQRLGGSRGKKKR